MDDTIKMQLKFLGLKHIFENWDEILSEAKKKQPSNYSFLTNLIEKEFVCRQDKARTARLNRAKIPRVWVMETFPFDRQPKLRKKLVLELYDSMKFLTEKQNLVFIGPTGCGKTGLATAFLVHAINQGYRGYFIEFKDLT
jgi:DNA replication protein DnaC